jgi:spore coat polysaccharide biosynthesis protein SpsF
LKTAILITARLKSVRLPLKVLKSIKSRPMLCHMLDRLKLAQKPEQIILCTSTIEEDKPLVEIAIQENVRYFCGDPEDVLLRLTKAAEEFDVDTVVSCTADNPFVDPNYIDYLVDFHLKHKNEFSNIEGLPFGTFSYALSYPAMMKACEIKDKLDTEVWGGYFTQTGVFRCGTMLVKDPAVRWPDLRLTVDTPEDFNLIRSIFDELYQPGKIFSLAQIVTLCRHKPELLAINAAVKQASGKRIKVKADLLNKHDKVC